MQRLRELWVGDRAAKALIALGEIAAKPGPLPRKFQSKTSYDLQTSLNDAEAMVHAHQRSDSQLVELQIQPGRWWANAQFPEGYLDQLYLQTFLYELLLNVSKYGRIFLKNAHRLANVKISSIFRGDILEVCIENPLSEEDAGKAWSTDSNIAVPKHRAEGEYKTHGFLGFAQALPVYMPGIRIDSKLRQSQQNKFYQCTLSLGPIAVVQDGQRMKVAPVRG